MKAGEENIVKFRKEILDKFITTREATLNICSFLERDDYMVQSTEDTSPPKWHLAHTTWFFDRFILRECIEEYRPLDATYDTIFNSYYNSLGKFIEKKNRMFLSRPSLEKVLEYRKSVESDILDMIEGCDDNILSLIELGINHEQQHQELLVMDIKENMFRSPYFPTFSRKIPQDMDAAPMRWKKYEEGIVEIGHNGAGFSFDNELPRHKVYIGPYALSSRLVTNGEYIEFIKDEGYSRPELWLSDGWDQVKRMNWKMPHYWVRNENGFGYYTPSGMMEIRLNEPVCHVSYFEADAYARWKGYAIPTEFQWENAMNLTPHKEGNFLEDETFHPMVQSNEGMNGPGACWEWTSSSYSPYPGYKPPKGSTGEYNGKFMSGKMVLRGACAATPKKHARITYRNYYPPESRWQFSGIRLAEVL